MLLNEEYKQRIQQLAGILSEDVALKATSGRSDAGTLSWYAEQYLLRIGGEILSLLDNEVEKNPNLILSLSKSSTRIMSNSLVIKLIIEGNIKGRAVKEEFNLVLSVNIETDSNTVASVVYKGFSNKSNLSSKHSSKDLDLFKNEVVENIISSIELATRK